MSYYIACDCGTGPFETLAEAEFAAEQLANQMENTPSKHKKGRTVKVLSHLKDVKAARKFFG